MSTLLTSGKCRLTLGPRGRGPIIGDASGRVKPVWRRSRRGDWTVPGPPLGSRWLDPHLPTHPSTCREGLARLRIGGHGAITTTVHKLSRLVYRMRKFGTDYVSQPLVESEAQVREKLERNLRRKAQALGDELVAKAPASPS